MSVVDDIPAIFLDKISPKALGTIQKCKDFVNDFCLPADQIYFSQIPLDAEKRWKSTPPVLEKLKIKAKLLGLWNMFLSNRYSEGGGYTNLEYGIMAEYLGRSFTAPMATNTAAPDTGNMEILARYGTPEQKSKWLRPLLDGKIRSAFLMTEKGTSSSNALNISCSAKQNEKGNFIVNGVKWFASGAGDPHCKVWLVMCKTGSGKNVYGNHTVLVIDAEKALKSGKAKLVRPLTVFGYDDAPHGHCEVKFDDYELDLGDPNQVILHNLGSGFEVIQSRLGPGRIHHCMRCIGVGEMALMRVVHRANQRRIFGTLLKDKELFLTAYAQFKIDIERCRLLVLNAAHKIDLAGAKGAMREIAIAKIETPRTVLKILDWGIQMYGAEGVSQDTELAREYALNRTLRIADGPDEAHLNQLAKVAAKKFAETDAYFDKIEAQRKVVAKM